MTEKKPTKKKTKEIFLFKKQKKKKLAPGLNWAEENNKKMQFLNPCTLKFCDGYQPQLPHIVRRTELYITFSTQVLYKCTKCTLNAHTLSYTLIGKWPPNELVNLLIHRYWCHLIAYFFHCYYAQAMHQIYLYRLSNNNKIQRLRRRRQQKQEQSAAHARYILFMVILVCSVFLGWFWLVSRRLIIFYWIHCNRNEIIVHMKLFLY